MTPVAITVAGVFCWRVLWVGVLGLDVDSLKTFISKLSKLIL